MRPRSSRRGSSGILAVRRSAIGVGWRTNAARRVRSSVAPDLEGPHGEAGDEGDAHRSTRRRHDADEAGQDRSIALEQREGGDHGEEEQRVGVDDAEEVERERVAEEQGEGDPGRSLPEERRDPPVEQHGHAGSGGERDEDAGDGEVPEQERPDDAHRRRVGREEGDGRLLVRAGVEVATAGDRVVPAAVPPRVGVEPRRQRELRRAGLEVDELHRQPPVQEDEDDEADEERSGERAPVARDAAEGRHGNAGFVAAATMETPKGRRVRRPGRDRIRRSTSRSRINRRFTGPGTSPVSLCGAGGSEPRRSRLDDPDGDDRGNRTR